MSFLNISCYQFCCVEEGRLAEMRQEMLQHALSVNVKGTILLSAEGINFFIAGREKDVSSQLEYINSLGFSTKNAKQSWSEKQPFTRMLVKVKKEIIAFIEADLCYASEDAKYVAPKELKAWLDQGEDLVLLDTRNDYEIRIGTFENAMDLEIKNFRDFPEKIKPLLPKLENKKIISFCTGGIRCEKAARWLESKGCKQVYQLEGGILKYFEECAAAHYKGDCFVFDHRVAVDGNLQETEVSMCFKCREPITKIQRLKGEHCPYCLQLWQDQETIA
jgi:UPF0176 protein